MGLWFVLRLATCGVGRNGRGPPEISSSLIKRELEQHQQPLLLPSTSFGAYTEGPMFPNKEYENNPSSL